MSETDKVTDVEMIALTNEEIKKQFNDLWAAIHEGNETAYTFAEYCKGFEHLCAGILKTKNYSDHFQKEYVDGLLEVFTKIKGIGKGMV